MEVSMKFVSQGPINNIPILLQIMAWAGRPTSHYLNWWWLFYWCIYVPLSLNELIHQVMSSHVYVNLITTESEDGLAPKGARPSADTVMMIKLDMLLLTGNNDFKFVFIDPTKLFKMAKTLS